MDAPRDADPVRHDRLIHSLLSSYPHAARCPACRGYLGDVAEVPLGAQDLVAGVLAFHDGGHRRDPLATATEHFALATGVTE
jgi:hypothetical protein